VGLLSTFTIALALALTIAAPVVCLLVWDRLGSNRLIRLAVRTALLVTAQILAVALAGLALNRAYDFYTSWSELLGGPIVTTTAAPATGGSAGRADAAFAASTAAAYRAGHGTVVRITIPGAASGVAAHTALVYLPAAYGNPAAAGVSFPVVELLDGFPGSPWSWTGPMQVQHVLDKLIAGMQSLPFIAVMPTQNISYPRDAECVNVVGGAQVDTYLTTDVHRTMTSNFRASSSPSSWSTMGFSTGGYCAINLAMRHPDMFSAAVSLSGTGRPSHDHSTGDLFGRSIAIGDSNTPFWEAAHWNSRNRLSIMMIAGSAEPLEYRDARGLPGLARGTLTITNTLIAHGGHNFTLWRAVEPYAFNWLSTHLRAPLQPVLIRTGLLPAQRPAVAAQRLPMPTNRN